MPDEDDIQKQFRERMGLRLGAEMSLYVQRKLAEGETGKLPVIALDARTGVPLRRDVDPADVRRLLATDQKQ